MWKPILEITILWFVIYRILLFFEGTRAIQVLRGIIVLCVAFILFQTLRLDTLDWLLKQLFGTSIIAVLIIFLPEIRQGLARLGQRHLFGSTLQEGELDFLLREVLKAMEGLAKEGMGAIIAFEKNDPLNAYIESGDIIDSRISADLLQAIFTPNNPLHDGGVVIQRGRVSAAGCLFPLAENQQLSRIFGTRHRAALGLSEETDALIVVVSEERRDSSLFYRGKLFKDLSYEEMFSKMKDILKSGKDYA